MVVASLLTISAAPIWHSHEHAGDQAGVARSPEPDGRDQDDRSKQKPHDEDSCSLCAAVHSPTGDGLASLPLFKPLPGGVLVRWMGDERAAVLWVGSDRASRGPPVST